MEWLNQGQVPIKGRRIWEGLTQKHALDIMSTSIISVNEHNLQHGQMSSTALSLDVRISLFNQPVGLLKSP